MLALRALCRAARGPGCLPPPWRGWTGLSDQVSLGGKESKLIKFSCGWNESFFFFLCIAGMGFTVEVISVGIQRV